MLNYGEMTSAEDGAGTSASFALVHGKTREVVFVSAAQDVVPHLRCPTHRYSY